MSRYNNWYFKDWKAEEKLTPTGKRKVGYVYTGRFYVLPGKEGQFKKACLGTAALYLAAFIWMAFAGTTGGRSRYVGSFCLLNVIPVLQFLMGSAAVLKAPMEITHRRYHRIFFRYRWAGVLASIMLLAQFVSEIVYVVQNGGLLNEVIYFVILTPVMALMWFFTFFILKVKLKTTDPDPRRQLPPDE